MQHAGGHLPLESGSSSGCCAPGEKCCRTNGTTAVAALAARLALGVLFLFSGAVKLGWLGGDLGNPEQFAAAIHKFHVMSPRFIPVAAFVIPWIEYLCGLCLFIGLATRGAGRALVGLLLVFTGGIIAVMARGIQLEVGECSCFGGHLGDWLGPVGEFLEAPIGPTSLVRNGVLMAIALVPAAVGCGMLGVDRLIACAGRGKDASAGA